jgi:hypothetical protein
MYSEQLHPSLRLADLGVTLAIGCSEQMGRSMGIEVMIASLAFAVEPMHVSAATLATDEVT